MQGIEHFDAFLLACIALTSACPSSLREQTRQDIEIFRPV
jgi:hypothetical protein